MGISNLSFSATNVNVGLDDDKSANPRAGDMYLSTDTGIFYKCFVDDAWVSDLKTKTGSYTGDYTVNRAIPHTLDAKPLLVVIERSSGDLVGISVVDTNFVRIINGAATDYQTVTARDSTNFYIPQELNASEQDYDWVVIS